LQRLRRRFEVLRHHAVDDIDLGIAAEGGELRRGGVGGDDEYLAGPEEIESVAGEEPPPTVKSGL
jgi:hypothetical protein